MSRSVSPTEIFTGRVKWFNNKSGYGFITITDGPKSGNDIFVHHSSIKVASEQYKYLVQGEYVDFYLFESDNDDHEYQASEVCGVNGGKLMCETRRDNRTARSQYRASRTTQSDSEPEVKMPKSVPPPKQRTQKQPTNEKKSKDKDTWTYVGKNTEQKTSKGRGRPKKVNEHTHNSTR